MEARRSFDEIAEIYDRIRPSYPPSLYDDLFDLLPVEPLILEVGPGTGKATRGLLAHGARVRAVEIGPAMADKLRGELLSEQLTVEVGDFGHVPVAVSVYDCVFAATAYHWISAEEQLDRPATLLKQDGVLAIVELIQVDSPSDRGFFVAAQPIYERHGQGHTGPPAPSRDAVDPAIRAAVEHDPRFSTVQVRHYDWDQTYTAAQYRLLMESYSVTQLMAPDDRQALLDDMESFVRDRFDDTVVRPLVVTLTTATRSRML
jgi:SAM-dependent methyltransferase